MKYIPEDVFINHVDILDINTIAVLLKTNKTFYKVINPLMDNLLKKDFIPFQYIYSIKITKNNTLFNIIRFKKVLNLWDTLLKGNLIPLKNKDINIFNQTNIIITDEKIFNTLNILMEIQVKLYDSKIANHKKLPYQLLNIMYIYKFIDWILFEKKELFIDNIKFIKTTIIKLQEILYACQFHKKNIDSKYLFMFTKCTCYFRYINRRLYKHLTTL